MTPRQVKAAKRAAKAARQARRNGPIDYSALMRDVPRKGKRTHVLASTARSHDGSRSGWAQSPHGPITPTMLDPRWDVQGKSA